MSKTQADQFEVRDTRQTGWFFAHNAVYDQYAAKVGINAFAVYMALCRHADDQQEARPSHGLIAKRLNVSRRTVVRAMQTLEEAGLVKVEATVRENGSYTSNTYTLLACDSQSHPLCQTVTPPVTHSHNIEEYPLNNKLSSSEDESQLIDAELAGNLAVGYKAATYLEGQISKRLPKRKGKTAAELKKWAMDIEKIVRIDGYTWHDVRAVIDWCQADDFWQNNILSGSKLRKQFEQLYLKMPSTSINKESEFARKLREQGLSA